MFLANSALIARAFVDDTTAIRTTNRITSITPAFVFTFFPAPRARWISPYCHNDLTRKFNASISVQQIIYYVNSNETPILLNETWCSDL